MATPRNDTPRGRPERDVKTKQGKKLRGLLKQTKPAEFDAAARERVGEAIARAKSIRARRGY